MSRFFTCAALIFLLAVPVFYLLTKYFYAEDLMDVIEAVERGKRLPDLDLERDIVAGMVMQLSLTFAVLCAALYITVRYASRRLWKPFDDSLAKAERFNLTEGDIPRLEASEITEFNRLNGSLSRLMIKSRKAYRIQKEFAENASHELQTPLAVARGKLDLLMQEALTPRQLALVADLYRLNSRMEHLNRNLLLLAKIENSQYEQREEVRPGEFIAGLLPSYRLLRPDGGVTFAADGAADMCVSANPALFECMINNLVVNAIRHSGPGDDIDIRISSGPTVAVSNPAPDGPLDPEKIFGRFLTAAGRTVPGGGTGLGLAIVKAICDYHGWHVAYTCTGGRHRFTVSMTPAGARCYSRGESAGSAS